MTVTNKGPLAIVDFDRPEVANSLREQDWKLLGETFRDLSTAGDTSLIQLRGSGKHFCAGMDVSVLQSFAQRATGTERPEAAIRKLIEEVQDSITAISNCTKPVIASIQGACIGGGVAIATACDFRICADDAHFTIKEVDFGIVADIGTLQRMPRIVQPALVAELAMTARKMYAPEARAAGFVTQVFDAVEGMNAFAEKLAAVLASKDPQVITGIKQQLAYALEHPVEDGLRTIAKYSAAMLSRRLK